MPEVPTSIPKARGESTIGATVYGGCAKRKRRWQAPLSENLDSKDQLVNEAIKN
jgi:hypothetical protein